VKQSVHHVTTTMAATSLPRDSSMRTRSVNGGRGDDHDTQTHRQTKQQPHRDSSQQVATTSSVSVLDANRNNRGPSTSPRRKRTEPNRTELASSAADDPKRRHWSHFSKTGQTGIGIASYGALGHVPPPPEFQQFIFFQFTLELH